MPLPSARGPQKRWTNFFKLLDPDNTGSIEARNAKHAVEILQKGGYFTADEHSQILTVLEDLLGGFINSGNNTNGNVSLDQFLETTQNRIIGKPMSETPEWWKDGVDKLFTIGARNGTGEIPKEEFIKFCTSLSKSVSPETAQQAYKQLPNPVTRAHLQEEVWTWASSTVAVSEDASLSILIHDRAAEKAQQTSQQQPTA